jgi:hypothetical protein
MLIELRRCNSIGNIAGLLFLISIITKKEKISRIEIRNRCALENGVSVNCPGAVAFLEYLGLVDTNSETVTPYEILNELSEKERESLLDDLVKLCMNHLIEDGIFDADATGFDAEKGHLSIKRSAFPLAYAAIRNFMTLAGALDKEEHGEICVSDNYENDFTAQIRSRRKKITLEKLLKQQEDQSKRGLEAEEYVLNLERNRLPGKVSKIKRISDFDVAAGYDIVSFQNEQGQVYDCFIEVKCYIGSAHFYWSENESDVARIKGDSYVLCLVDYTRIGEPGYQPEYIKNPYKTIFSDEQWLVNTASYKIQRV